MSEDIRRFLHGLPVLASGDSLRYRAGKFVARHRLAVAAAVAQAVGVPKRVLRESRWLAATSAWQ
jgi:hypothetical protein